MVDRQECRMLREDRVKSLSRGQFLKEAVQGFEGNRLNQAIGPSSDRNHVRDIAHLLPVKTSGKRLAFIFWRCEACQSKYLGARSTRLPRSFDSTNLGDASYSSKIRHRKVNQQNTDNTLAWF
jgi:hypothetical protein